jgi:hypothetical protein
LTLWSICTQPKATRIVLDRNILTTSYSCVPVSSIIATISNFLLIVYNSLLLLCLFVVGIWNYNIPLEYNFSSTLIVFTFAQLLFIILYYCIDSFGLHYIDQVRIRIIFLVVYGAVGFSTFIVPVLLKVKYKGSFLINSLSSSKNSNSIKVKRKHKLYKILNENKLEPVFKSVSKVECLYIVRKNAICFVHY